MGARATLLEVYNQAMNLSGQAGYGGLGLGQLASGGTTSTSSPTVTLAQNAPSWVVASMNVYDVTAGGNCGKVSTVSNATVTLAANSTTAIANGDVLQFGFTPSDLAVGAAAGSDVRGLVQLAQLKCSEAIAVLTYLTSDVITNSQDLNAYTALQAAITSLS